jgi:hypothetical protein
MAHSFGHLTRDVVQGTGRYELMIPQRGSCQLLFQSLSYKIYKSVSVQHIIL